MRVKQRLQLNSAISVVAGFVIVLALVFASHFIFQAVETSTATGNIITNAYEMITFRNDYVESFSERAKVQWFSKYEEIGQLLKSAAEKSRNSANQAVVEELIEDHKSIGSIFASIVRNRGMAPNRAGMGELSQETERRLLTQLTTKNYDLVLNARMLQTTNRETIFSVLFRTASGIVGFLILIFAGVVINSRLMSRSITKRIDDLGEGAKMIGNGNLDLKIAIKGNDEFAELATSFNAMTGKLSDSYHELHKEITERKQAEEALRQSQERLALAASATHTGMFDWNVTRGTVLWTQAHEAIFGYLPAATTTTTTTTEHDHRRWADRVHPEDMPRVEEEMRRCQQDRKPLEVQYRIIWPDGSLHWVETKGVFLHNSDGKAERMLGVVMDVSERKQAELERETTVELLRLVNESKGLRELVRAVVTFFRRQSGCEAVGLRLREGEDYPYYETHGFPPEFVELENHLCSYDAAGRLLRDGAGYPVIECMCGNIICGRCDPAKPFFTSQGSFWTNCTTELLATSTEADRQARTRNRCNGEGYESVALIALRTGEERLGLIQLNDKRKGMFSAEIIALWERLAGYLAVALAKLQAEVDLHNSENALRQLNESLERRVQERTTALRDLTEQLERSRHELRKLASELVMAEERERKRVAGILHDEIAQTLAAARMRLDLLQSIPSDHKDKQTLQDVKDFLVQSIQEVRALMNDLGNPLLFDLGLKSACESLSYRLMEGHPIRIICDVRDEYKHLDPDMKAMLFQVIRELLNNVVKHSQAQNAHVLIDAENGQFRVKVADDGLGFDSKVLGVPSGEGGFGLYSIRERLTAMDGSLDIVSAPGTGTVVTAILPNSLD